MLEKITTRSIREREEMQAKYGTNVLPSQDLCYATYNTLQGGRKLVVDVLGTDEQEETALLSCVDRTGERRIWIAKRNQVGVPGTWMWTPEQLAAAKKNPTRIAPEENDFRGEVESRQIQVAPIHRDRRVEILMLGLQLNKSDAEVQEQLEKEGIDPTLPDNYRTERGELDLLKNWLPKQK